MGKRLPLLAAVLALAACSGKPVLEGERSPVFAAPAAPAKSGKPLKIEPSGEPLAFHRAYVADIGASPDSRVFQWPAGAAEGKVFAIDGTLRVSAFDATSGERLWRSTWITDGTPIWFGDVAYGDDALFAISSDGYFARFSGIDGTKRKEAKLPMRLKSGAVFCEGRVFFSGEDNELYGIDAATLEITFTHRALSEPFQLMGGARPLCAGGKVFAPFSNGELHAIDAKSGKVLWLASVSGARALGLFADIVAPPVAAGKAVVAKSFYGPMRALDMASGKELWSRPSDGAAAPLYIGNVLFDVAGTQLCALDAATGASFYCTGLAGRRTYFSPIMAGGELLLARDDGAIEVRSPGDGSLIRTVDAARGITSDPFVYDGMLFLQRKYSLYAFR
jgi:outer membrane protein assembly factor BamB